MSTYTSENTYITLYEGQSYSFTNHWGVSPNYGLIKLHTPALGWPAVNGIDFDTATAGYENDWYWTWKNHPGGNFPSGLDATVTANVDGTKEFDENFVITIEMGFYDPYADDWSYNVYYVNYNFTIKGDLKPPSARDLKIDGNIGAATADQNNLYNKTQQEIDFLQAQLDLEKQKIDGLSDEQKGAWALQALQTLKAAGDLAGLGLGITGTGVARTGLIEALRTLQGVTNAEKLATEIGKTFNDPSLTNLAATASAMASLLTRATDYKGALNDLFNVSKTVKSLDQFYSGSKSFWNQNATIEQSIDDANQRIDSLQQRIDTLKNVPQDPGLKFTPSANVLTISNGSNSIKLLHNDDFNASLLPKANAAEKGFTDFIYGKNGQSLTVGSGNMIVDGASVTGEDLILKRSIESTKVEFGSDGMVRLSASGFSALLFDVDSIRFKDALIGSGGNDVLKVTGSIKELLGGDGNDSLIGGTSNDTLTGNDGNDTIKGNSGADVITGGFGKDKMWGGTGNDVFVFSRLFETGVDRQNADEIKDFRKGDRIDLSGIDANTTLNGNQNFQFIGSKGFSGHDGQLRSEKVGNGVMIYGDVNGDGIADLAIQVNGVSSLKSADFFL